MAAGLVALVFGQACAQQSVPQAKELDNLPPLTLRTRIPLPGVYGRLDHYGWDGKRAHLIVSALGNDTVESANSWKRVRTITGLEHPQAAVYVPGIDRIAVSSQSGSCVSTMRNPLCSSKPRILGPTLIPTTCATIRYRGAFM